MARRKDSFIAIKAESINKINKKSELLCNFALREPTNMNKWVWNTDPAIAMPQKTQFYHEAFRTTTAAELNAKAAKQGIYIIQWDVYMECIHPEMIHK